MLLYIYISLIIIVVTLIILIALMAKYPDNLPLDVIFYVIIILAIILLSVIIYYRTPNLENINKKNDLDNINYN